MVKTKSLVGLFLILTACARESHPGPVVQGHSNKAYRQVISWVKQNLPVSGFTVIRQKPFVIIGNEPPVIVRQRARSTINWAVRHLKDLYFKKDPDHIITIWLFKDRESYHNYTKKIFGKVPATPFGFYSSHHRAMVMNIGTGGGTLVHEIVHPFMAANFPHCPAWFNEGLGSLYEQCQEKNGSIRGMTNWRLAGLQKAILEKKIPIFKDFTALTDQQFYDGDPGTNYAQARYLCFYLQEKGLLTSFYHLFYRNRKSDPTGLAALKKIVNIKDMDLFQSQWESYVLNLRFP